MVDTQSDQGSVLIGACGELNRALPDKKFYAHELDAIPIEEAGHDGRTAASWCGVREVSTQGVFWLMTLI